MQFNKLKTLELSRTSNTSRTSRTSKASELKLQVLIGILLLAVLFMTSACAVEFEDPNNSNQNVDAGTNSGVGTKAVAAKKKKVDFGPFEPLPEPGHYLYHGPNGETQEVISGTHVYGLNEKKERIAIKVPVDLVVADVVKAPVDQHTWELRTNGRLFLRRQALLKFGTKNLVIEAPMIVSDGGVLQSFHPSDKAGLGQEGLASGNIIIRAGEIVGALYLEARGQGGGDGNSGAALPRAANGESFDPMMGSDQCRHARLGGSGQNGKKGNDGERGRNGGRGGNITVEVGNEWVPSIKAASDGGLPGQGGHGGAGQLGGVGGRSSNRYMQLVYVTELKPKTNYRSCSNVPDNGPNGRDGQPGDRGADGLVGLPGEIKIN